MAPSPFPIWIAAVNERMQRFAGEIADGLCGHPVFSADYLRDVVRPNIDAGRRSAGRDTPFELAAWANTVVLTCTREKQGVGLCEQEEPTPRPCHSKG